MGEVFSCYVACVCVCVLGGGMGNAVLQKNFESSLFPFEYEMEEKVCLSNN